MCQQFISLNGPLLSSPLREQQDQVQGEQLHLLQTVMPAVCSIALCDCASWAGASSRLLPAEDPALNCLPQRAAAISFPLLKFYHTNLRGRKTTKRAFGNLFGHIKWNAVYLHTFLLWLEVCLAISPSLSVFLSLYLGCAAGETPPVL